MTTNRHTAIVAGALFIIAAVVSITGLILYSPVLHDADYIVTDAAKEINVLWGAFFEIILAFAVIGTSVTLFPVLKKYNESMALGAVCFRLLEAAIIIIGIISLLTIVTLNHRYSAEIHPNTQAYLLTGKLLLAIHNWTFLFGPNLALGPSTLMTSYLLHRSKLVPRFICILGLVGGPLIFICALLVMFGVFPQISVWGAVLAVPVFAYEMSLAVWLIFKGLHSPVIGQPEQSLKNHMLTGRTLPL